MADTNEYLKRYNETKNDLVKPTNLGGGDDYYKLARDQEYGLLFDKEVALENAKANAMKYTQNRINAQGFGGTGYGSSMQSGIYNTYLNKANEARNDYANNVREINLQEQQELKDQANDRFQSITTMLTQAGNQEQMDNLLSEYGYGSFDNDNNFVWGEKPEGMSNDDWIQMKYYYGLQKTAFDEEAKASSMQNAEFTLNDATFMYSDADGKNYRTMTNGDDLSQELNATRMGIATGQIPSGSYIHLQSKDGKHMFMKYENGKLYYVNKSDYMGADSENCYYCYGRNEMQNTKK